MNKKLIVISAVNLVEAGTLAILKECLCYLSSLAELGEYRVIAIVFDKNLVHYPNIEYIETKWPKKRWVNRLWYEYRSMNEISKQLAPVYLWFSLHDTSPTVQAERRAVYCHNAYFNYHWRLHDLIFAPKIVLFALFTKFIYRTNITKNNYIIVQQNWLREAIHSIFKIPKSKIIVARPESSLLKIEKVKDLKSDGVYTFIFAGSPNSHKNFEVICKAVEIVQQVFKMDNFKVSITVKGDENKYAAWLLKHWGKLDKINFVGFVHKDKLFQMYKDSQCLIFPSKAESWGLPISEFSQFGKPMLLADLPYAHETAEGSSYTAFFDPNNAMDLAVLMRELINNNLDVLHAMSKKKISEPFVNNWKDLFTKLLN